MAKLFSLHKVSLRPGINTEEFERFATQEYFPAHKVPGLTIHLLRGERGDREGKYLLMLEFDSVEVRNEYIPVTGQPSEKLVKIFEAVPKEMKEKWDGFAFNFGDPHFTDYVVVE